MQVIIVGAGLGGLTCAIACRRAGMDVVILEQSDVISEIGAGIQIPPNACRVMDRLEILPTLMALATKVGCLDLRRYRDGSVLAHRPVTKELNSSQQYDWYVIHRADYHRVLLEEAKRLGVTVTLSARVREVDIIKSAVVLASGSVMSADLLIGADGLWSVTRESLLDQPSPPYETGDLAYRVTIPRAVLLEKNNPQINALCNRTDVTVWMGPGRHCVWYPVKQGKIFNLVIIRPDNMPAGSKIEQEDLGEMRQTVQGWDPVLTEIISCVPSITKWKLLHHEELQTWTKACTAILGDACHPTLPYQAQGAAMAVEDAALLGLLLGEYQSAMEVCGRTDTRTLLPSLLQLYEKLRKPRTSLNVQGAIDNQHFYHMVDGPQQEQRDEDLKKHDWKNGRSKFRWMDAQYQGDLLGYDVMAHGQEAFRTWWNESGMPRGG